MTCYLHSPLPPSPEHWRPCTTSNSIRLGLLFILHLYSFNDQTHSMLSFCCLFGIRRSHTLQSRKFVQSFIHYPPTPTTTTTTTTIYYVFLLCIGPSSCQGRPTPEPRPYDTPGVPTSNPSSLVHHHHRKQQHHRQYSHPLS